MARTQQATWNRDDRDLLVELRTQMLSMSSDIAAARIEIKEINTGITSRLLNLEANSLSKIEVNPKLEDFEIRIASFEELRAQVKTWGFIVALMVIPALGWFYLQFFSLSSTLDHRINTAITISLENYSLIKSQ